MLFRFLVVLLLSSSVFAQIINPSGNAVGVDRFGYCDPQLPKSGWSPQLVASPGGFSTVSPSSGGNPGAHQQVTISGPAGTAVAHFLAGEIIDPAVEGEVLDIDGSFHARRIKGQPMRVGLVIEQQGVHFAGPLTTITSTTAWQQVAHTKLTAANFTRLGTTGPGHPSFACAAKPLRVGFVTILTTASLQSRVAIDTWCVTLRTRCCTTSGSAMHVAVNVSGHGDCCEDALTPSREGGYDLPADADPNEPPSVESVNEVIGYADELYPHFDTSVDTWYAQQPCDSCVGGTIPPEASDPDVQSGLTAAGIEATPEEVRDTVAEIEQVLAQQSDQDPPRFDAMAPIVDGYQAPATPHRSHSNGPWVFHGRDIVFVHGLEPDHLTDYLLGTNPAATATWKNPGSQNAWSVNPEFYRTGYFKQKAEAQWSSHISQFLSQRNIQNRYLVVAYNSNERLSGAVQAILRQIADAMKSGEGVVSPDGDTTNFGTPSMVIIDYSTGAPVTSVALSVASLYPHLGVQFIPRHTKAVIAAQGVFSGSRYASAALAASPGVGFACKLAQMGLRALGMSALPLDCKNFDHLRQTILVDLVPLVMQVRWAPIIALNPVRTLTVAGAHPTETPVAKWLFLPGYDDGVTNANSAVGNPNAVLFWPSGFGMLGGYQRAFDAPVAFPAGVQTIRIGPAQLQFNSNMLNSPRRAVGYFVDQTIDKKFSPFSTWILPTALVAGGPIPWVSPTGMRQPVDFVYPPSPPGPGVTMGYTAMERTPRHFSFLFGAADHYLGLESGPDYAPSNGELNLEETRAISDPAVYLPYPMPYPGDHAALLEPSTVPRVVEIRRGIRVRFRLTARRRWREAWIFSRRYYLLEGWETKTQFDYVYDSVLRN